MTSSSNNGNGGGTSRSLIVKDLVKAYVPGKPVLKNISFEVRGRSTVAIIGPSGTGKSTLLRCINRLIDPTSGTITVAWTRQADGSAVFAVADTGPGIDPAHIARLTERFYRVDRSRSRDTGGTGLGLAIVKHVLQRHGAALHIDSVLGKGSVFSAHFPALRLR